MSAAVKRADNGHDNARNKVDFPPEAFCYDDDVTTDAVDSLKKKAAPKIDSEKWIRVDGFGNPFCS